MLNMSNKNKLFFLVAGPSTVLASTLLGAEPNAPDNTSQNKRDRATSSVTADQQGMNQSDTDITAKIRRDLLNQSALSTNAKNVKIITENGKVTLKGPVDSESEKNLIQRTAVAIAGVANINNEIAVKETTK